MDNHDKMKNYSNYFETAIVGVGIIAMIVGVLVLGIIKLIIK